MVVRRCVSMIMMRVLMTLAALASASAFAVTPARWVGPHKVFGAGRALTLRLRVAAPPVVTRLALQNDGTGVFGPNMQGRTLCTHLPRRRTVELSIQK